MIVKDEYIQDAIAGLNEPGSVVQRGEGVSIETAFKNLRWTRVIALRDYKEQSVHIFKMVDDILYGQQQLADIKLDGLPQLCAHFDPIKWQEQN